MKAIIKEKKGIFVRNIPIPQPRASDVLIKVMIAGYCRTDGYVAQDRIKTKTPLVLGHEFSGIIHSFGRNVRKFKKGDRVAVMPILRDRHGCYSGSMLGLDTHGGFAEYVCVPQESVYKIPDKLSFKEGAYLEPIAASLAVLKAPIKRNNMGLILGNNRIAKLTQKILKIYRFKSVKIIPENNLKRIASNSYDFAIETLLSTENLSELIRILKPNGIIILKSRQYSPVEVSIGRIVQKDLKIFGTYYGDFNEGIRLLESKKLNVKNIFGRVYKLEAALKILNGRIDKKENKKIFFNLNLCAE